MTEKPDLPEDFGNPWMSNLEEIELPESVPFTFETPGWYLVAGLALVVVLRLAWRLWKRWQADAYRRVALRELDEIERSGPERIPELLKRVALVAYPRTRVADLSGDAWLGFLDGTLGTTEFSRGLGRWLPELAYDQGSTARIDDQQRQQLFALARRWIQRHHRAERPARRPAASTLGREARA